MSKTARLLSAILGISLVINAVILFRYSKLNERVAALERKPAAAPAAAPPAPEPRIAPPRNGPTTPPPGDPVVASTPVPFNPRLVEVLAEQDSAAAFWKELNRLAQGAVAMEPREFRTFAFETTARYLKLDAATFGQTAQAAMDALTAHEKAYQEEWRPIWESRDKDPATFEARSKEFAARMDAARKGIMSQLDGLLSPETNRAHRRFAVRLEDWMQLVRHPDMVEKD